MNLSNLLFWRHKRNKKAIISDKDKAKLPPRYHDHFEPVHGGHGQYSQLPTRPTATVIQHEAAGDDGFLMSMLIAEETDSVVDGTLFGGNLFGAIIGEEISESHYHEVSPDYDGGNTGGGGSTGTWDTPSQDTTPSYDPTPSYDNSSSSDSSYSTSDSGLQL